MDKNRSFLKWPGNKFYCLEYILNALKPAKRLIEPFTGSGVVFMNTAYSDYLLAEKNKDLINLFKQLQVQGPVFIDYCAKFFNLENNCAHKYYQFRNEFNARTASSRRQAAIFLYLNRHGFNGLCRYNQQGCYNVPFGYYKRPYFPTLEMNFFHLKSHNVKFSFSDFRKTFAIAQPGDIIYCDPPYVPLSNTANFATYTKKKFLLNDHLDLVNLARSAANRGIPVVISNHDTEFTRYHYHDSQLYYFLAPRLINCQALGRRPVQELLAVFY